MSRAEAIPVGTPRSFLAKQGSITAKQSPLVSQAVISLLVRTEWSEAFSPGIQIILTSYSSALLNKFIADLYESDPVAARLGFKPWTLSASIFSKNKASAGTFVPSKPPAKDPEDAFGRFLRFTDAVFPFASR